MEISFESMHESMRSVGSKSNKSKKKGNEKKKRNENENSTPQSEEGPMMEGSAPASMSKDEMMKHFQLCMQLAAANKINMKNAFGLHLIGIMRQLFKDQVHDFQQASLSLQASSKIYAGRVDALYQDTFQFHSHLQTVLGGKSKDSIPKEANADSSITDLDDESEKKQRISEKRKCK
ncbi:Condensin complex subunit 2, partial [Stegodyphus mimosarum]